MEKRLAVIDRRLLQLFYEVFGEWPTFPSFLLLGYSGVSLVLGALTVRQSGVIRVPFEFDEIRALIFFWVVGLVPWLMEFGYPPGSFTASRVSRFLFCFCFVPGYVYLIFRSSAVFPAVYNFGWLCFVTALLFQWMATYCIASRVIILDEYTGAHSD